MTTPSPDEVAAAMTPAGGWTMAILASWGVNGRRRADGVTNSGVAGWQVRQRKRPGSDARPES